MNIPSSQGEKVLQAWYNILKILAKLRCCPNIFINPMATKINMMQRQAFGVGKEKANLILGRPKSGYDCPLLEQLLKDYNLSDIKSLKKVTNKHLYVECYKVLFVIFFFFFFFA